jgi:hypothetical protein
MDREAEALRAYAWPAYLIALLLIVFPLVDVAANVWPPRLGDLQWRFGTVGLLAGFILTPLLGMLVAVAAAAIRGDRVFQRFVALLNLALALVLSVMFVVFALDWLQVRTTIPPSGHGTIDVGSVKALVRYAGVALALAWLGVMGWRVSRQSGGRSRRAKAPLIRQADGEAP